MGTQSISVTSLKFRLNYDHDEKKYQESSYMLSYSLMDLWFVGLCVSQRSIKEILFICFFCVFWPKQFICLGTYIL